MSAFGLLARAKAAGITLAADADGLLWEADRDPPDALLAELAAHKAELMTLLGGQDMSIGGRPAAEALAKRAAIQAEANRPTRAPAESATAGTGLLVGAKSEDPPELASLSPSCTEAVTAWPNGQLELRRRLPDGSWLAPVPLRLDDELGRAA